MGIQEITSIAIDLVNELWRNNMRPIAIVVPEALKAEIRKHLPVAAPEANTDRFVGCDVIWSSGSLMKVIGVDAIVRLLESQKLYDYITKKVEVATIRQELEEKSGRMLSPEVGRKEAYKDIAQKLIDMGCKPGGKDNAGQ